MIDGFAAVVLAGGAARRMGGATKPALDIGGEPMLARVLAAVTAASPQVIVGPPELPVPPGVTLTCESPAGGGPVAGLAAGLALVNERVSGAPGACQVAVLAGDLPLLTTAAVTLLQSALTERYDAAVYVDAAGRRQWLCALWRADALAAALTALPAGPAGASMRELYASARCAETTWSDPGPPPWFDCDTYDDLRQAREWQR
ncbi:molybdenum cofactor guanylyltransferase [Pilimelia columellifera]|uniref:MobA-like NTP transferase domain-containing protein n=1 Tax=Pilimelia columellifera subsp. columellifera TaxID=706583 RepID=A0ABN3NIE8_9ACTN